MLIWIPYYGSKFNPKVAVADCSQALLLDKDKTNMSAAVGWQNTTTGWSDANSFAISIIQLTRQYMFVGDIGKVRVQQLSN